ncbi:hypothetical protein V3C99_005451 [Haemonchus contortus]
MFAWVAHHIQWCHTIVHLIPHICTYLGELIPISNNSNAVFKRRKRCAWAAVGSNKEMALLVPNKKIRADYGLDGVARTLLSIRDRREEEINAIATRGQKALEWTLLNMSCREQRSRNLCSKGPYA